MEVEREKVKRMQEKFLRWMLGVEGRTLGYMIRKELQREILKSRAGKRAWGYEEKLMKGKGSMLAQRCLREVRQRVSKDGGMSGWERQRKQFFEERGMKISE